MSSSSASGWYGARSNETFFNRFSTHSWFCSFMDTKKRWLILFPLCPSTFYYSGALMEKLFGGNHGWEGVQSVSLIRRQTADVIGCQSVENRKRFFPFFLTGSSTSDRRSHSGSHLHLNKDSQWLCQSPLSKLPYLMNASTISFLHSS